MSDMEPTIPKFLSLNSGINIKIILREIPCIIIDYKTNSQPSSIAIFDK